MLLAYLSVNLDHLWTQCDLEEMNEEDGISLPKDLESEVLQKVMVLLVTGNINEFLAAYSYLQPLDGHNNIYKYSRALNQQNQVVMYCIGKYGECLAAIRIVLPDVRVDSSALMIADQCFPNLSAIISVGVACGIKRKAKLCDVLVSSKVVNYYKTSNDSPREEAITISPQLIRLFTQYKQWNNSYRQYLSHNKISTPNVKSGVILSGPYHVEDPVMKTSLDINSVAEAIGIEVEETHVFSGNQQSIIIVKGVCNYFGDGKYNKLYQPTAALIAADLVCKCLSDPQVYEVFKGLYSNLSSNVTLSDL